MLTGKMNEVSKAIEDTIIEVFPTQYLIKLLSSRITLQDLTNQILVECCKYAYDQTQEKHSLDYYLGGAVHAEDSERMMHQRTIDYIRDKKTIYYQILGFDAKHLVPEKMQSIKAKLEGHKFTDFQFWEICNVHDMQLVKAIIEKRIGKPNFSTDKIEAYAKEYNNFLVERQKDWEVKRSNPLFDFLAFFTLEWKYSFEFIYELAAEMANANIKNIPDMRQRIALFAGQFTLVSDLIIANPEIMPTPITTENRMILVRRKFLPDVVESDTEEFEKIRYLFMQAQVVVASMLLRMTLGGVHLRAWFVAHTDESDWLSVFQEYNIFQVFNSEKIWDKKVSRRLKDIYNAVSMDYKNPEIRS